MKGISLAIVLALSSVVVWAQGTSQIQGVVKDATGAVIGGAEVKATQTETGGARMVINAEDGVYVLPNLAICLPATSGTLRPFFLRLAAGQPAALELRPGGKRRVCDIDTRPPAFVFLILSLASLQSVQSPPAVIERLLLFSAALAS